MSVPEAVGSPAKTPRGLAWLALATILLVFLSTYAPMFSVGLLSDDWTMMTGRFPWYSFTNGMFGGEGQYYRPIPRIALFVQGQWFGYSGVAQHFISLVLFLGAAAALARGVWRHAGALAAVFATAFLLINPNLTETLAWAATQQDLFAGLFCMLSALMLLGPLGKGRVALSLVLGVLAYMSKESAIWLGITIPAAMGYLLFRGLSRQWRAPMIAAAIGHLALLGLYFIARKAFLGQFGLDPADYQPPAGWMEHYLANAMTVALETVRGYLGVPAEWGFLAGGRHLPLWLPLIVLFWLVWCYRRGEHALIVLTIAFLAAAVPAVLARHPWFYASLATSRRYLFIGAFPLAAMLGLTAARAWSALAPRARPLAMLAALGMALVVNVEMARRFDDWVRAAQLRDQVGREWKQAFAGIKRPQVVIERLPDHVGEAFVFRNGFDYYAKLALAAFDDDYYVADNLPLNRLEAGRPIYRLRYAGPGEPIITPAPDIEQLRDEALQSMRAARQP